MSETKTLHFTIGDDLGLRLMEIAQEQLTIDNDPVKAIETITKSLIGCPTDLAVQILLGKMVLPVDVESQNVMCEDRIKGEHDRFPAIDPIRFMELRTAQINKHADSLLEGFQALQKQIRDNKTLTIDFNYEDIFKFIAGNDEGIFDELKDNQEIDWISGLFETSKRFIEATMKTQATIKWMFETCPEFDGTMDENGKNFETYLELSGEIADSLNNVRFELSVTSKLNFNLDAPDDSVANYLEATREIDEVISKGIEPVDIMDNYSAGWLSPLGLYYALNGEIANMLHTQIADALQEKGLIPMYENNDPDGMEVNPDSWLEQKGWVKIHDNNVQFAGCLNDKISKTNVHMTDIQKKMIYEYISLCHSSVVRLGWKMEKISASRFQMTDDLMLAKHYFNF